MNSISSIPGTSIPSTIPQLPSASGMQRSALSPDTNQVLAETAMDTSQGQGQQDSISDIDYEAIVQQMINAAKLPETFSEDGINHLIQFLDLKIRAKVIILLEDQAKFRELQPLRNQMAEKMNCLRQFCRENHQDINNIETAITNQAEQLADEFATIEKRKLISAWRDWERHEVDQLAGNALIATYRECKSDKHLADSASARLSHLIELAEIPSEFRETYTVNIGYKQAPRETEGRFLIRIPHGNCALGYGIFDLLYSQNLLPAGNADYDGQTEFSLSKAQIIKLSEHIEELNKWYDDFLCIVGDLLGRDDSIAGDSADQFVSIGKKTTGEILLNPIRMTEGCQYLIRSLSPEQPCLLFNTLSINLENHDDKDFLKHKIESIYKENNMLGSNREPKQFLRGTYSTNLNVEQLRTICPHLNKLLKLQQLLTVVTETSSLRAAIDAFNAFGLGENELDPVKSYKTSLLYEIYQEIKGADQQEFLSIESAMANIQHISLIESNALERCKAILRDHSVCYFRKTANQPVIGDEQLYAIYGDSERDARYRGGQVHRNIAALCHTLQDCHAYQQYKVSNPGIDESLAALKRNFIDRLNRYSGMRAESYDGSRMVDESVEYFETFVSLLFYAEVYNLTDCSISTALNNLAAIVGDDLAGCNEGFSGRIQSLLLPLISGSNNKIKDCIQQFLKDSVTASLARAIGRSCESSMSARCQAQVNHFLGLSIAPDQTPANTYESLSSDSKKTISHLLHSLYTPVSLYQHVYQFLSDEFWRLNHERSDDEIYQLMHSLGFGTDQSLGADNEAYRQGIDRQYRVRGNPLNRWQYAFFQQDLPKYLVGYLVKEQYIEARHPGENDGSLYVHREASQGSDKIRPPARIFAAGTTESRPADANRRLGFEPESRMAQASYRTETS